MQGIIIFSIFEILKCDEFNSGENQKEYYIHTFLSEKCYTETYKFWFNYLMIPLFIFYAIILPLIAFIYIIIIRKNMNKKNNLIYISFLVNEYKSDNRFWEFWFLIRKLSLNLVVIFIDSKNGSKIIFLILLFSLYLQYFRKPYITKRLNKFEFESIFYSSLMLVLQLVSESLENQISQGICVALLILLDCLYVIKFLRMFLNLKLREIQKKRKSNKFLTMLSSLFINSKYSINSVFSYKLNIKIRS